MNGRSSERRIEHSHVDVGAEIDAAMDLYLDVVVELSPGWTNRKRAGEQLEQIGCITRRRQHRATVSLLGQACENAPRRVEGADIGRAGVAVSDRQRDGIGIGTRVCAFEQLVFPPPPGNAERPPFEMPVRH